MLTKTLSFTQTIVFDFLRLCVKTSKIGPHPYEAATRILCVDMRKAFEEYLAEHYSEHPLESMQRSPTAFGMAIAVVGQDAIEKRQYSIPGKGQKHFYVLQPPLELAKSLEYWSNATTRPAEERTADRRLDRIERSLVALQNQLSAIADLLTKKENGFE